MTSAQTTRGGCLCGAVSYEISGHLGIFQYCHCSRCRRFTGSAHAANLLVAPEHFRWLQGADNVRQYAPAETRHFATAFCLTCGSSMPWQGKSGKAVVIPAGTLADDPGIRPFQNIFWASRAPWYEPASALPCHDTLPQKKKPGSN